MEFGAASEDIARTCHAHPTLSEAVRQAAADGLAAMQSAVETVPVEDDVSRYCVELAAATRRARMGSRAGGLCR